MKSEIIKRILSSLILLPLVIFITFKGSWYFTLTLLICFFIVLYEWNRLEKRKIYFTLGLIFLLFSFFTVDQIRNSLFNDYLNFFLLLNICISNDIGGYLFGKIIKGPKLTKISPNKTISGSIGGYLVAIFTTIILFHSNLVNLNFKNFSMDNFIFVIFISTVSQIGDLIISLFKRNSEIKDTGQIIPGHGGLLDRIDGMIFVFPFSYLIFVLGIYQYF